MSRKKEPSIFKDDDDLWTAAMQGVKPLPGKRPKKSIKTKKNEPSGARETVITAPPSKKETPAPKARGQGLDARTDERLRTGKMEIDARLDLHGLKFKEAEEMLKKTLLRHYAQGKRCILVITGKGSAKSAKANENDWWETKPGVIKNALPTWLFNSPLSAIILRHCPAQTKHGGDGAFYVLLRRK